MTKPVWREIECSGVAASWCPRCGDCSCPRNADGEPLGDLDSPDCPLHALDSAHGQPAAAQEESLF